MESAEYTALPNLQRERFFNPSAGIEDDYDLIYNQGVVEVGWPEGAIKIFEYLARPHTGMVVGVELGDEGKGRFVDNKIGALLDIPGVKMVYAIRVQGGNNSGHTAEREGMKIATHLVPLGVMYEEVIGIMDSGMIIHDDLRDEVEILEGKVGDLGGKLYLSGDAILSTDLERAEELLNRKKKKEAGGGTGRGIGPAYAHHYDRQGFHIYDLLDDGWRDKFGTQYDSYAAEFRNHEMELSALDVPDFLGTKQTGEEHKRKVGTKEEFLDNLEDFRTWLIDRNMVRNTFIMHRNIYRDLQVGVVTELAQAMGLHAWLGTRPDVTSSDTSGYVVGPSTKLWKLEDFEDRVGIFKITYDSSVGAREMPTQVKLPKSIRKPEDLPSDAKPEEQWAAYVRDAAHEFGTTTGRPRDILHLDLELLRYNARMAGIESLAGTHLDIARENEYINVCTHYTDKYGKVVPYEPGLRHLEGIVPHYIRLPGWDGDAVRKARSFDELPENAKKFLSFIQRRTGYPIIAATTGPERSNYVDIPHYLPRNGTIFSLS